MYDAEGSPIGMQYRTNSYAEGVFDTYWFEKNLQGDIIGVYTAKGRKICSYAYDAWGNFKVIMDYDSGVSLENRQIVGYNPFRYRGYYYDQELGMYYLQSRYYDPVICRFINADSQLNGGLLGYNQYAYCENNPVRYIDPFGTINWDKFVQGALLFTVGALTVAAVIATGGTCAPWVAVGYAVLGASGVVAAGIGASEMVEAFTGSNPMREDLGSGMYNALMMGSLTIISFGPMILEMGNIYGNVCFVEGTLIATENGNIPIEEIEAGMLVYAHDPETGETALKPVVQTFRNEATELVHVNVNGEEIICTNEHPFYSPVKGWTAACQLRAGDILVTVNGEYVVVEKVQHELLESPVTVYNFEVEGFHTYFVGDTKVLVHNDCDKSKVDLGNKLDYAFGKGSGNQHNIDRSRGLLKELNNIGINDTPLGRQYLSDELIRIGTNIVGNGRIVFESMLYGPAGGIKMTTIWEAARLITIYLRR